MPTPSPAFPSLAHEGAIGTNSHPQWLKTEFCSKHGLVRRPKPKPLVGHQGLYGLLYYHWTFDSAVYQLERDRIQVAAAFLTIAYTTARPGSVLESGCAGIRGTNQALLYEDCTLKLLRPRDGSEPVLILELDMWLDKGKRHRGH